MSLKTLCTKDIFFPLQNVRNVKSNYLATPDMLFQLLLDLAPHKLCLSLHIQWASLIPFPSKLTGGKWWQNGGGGQLHLILPIRAASAQNWLFPLVQRLPATWGGQGLQALWLESLFSWVQQRLLVEDCKGEVIRRAMVSLSLSIPLEEQAFSRPTSDAP